MDRPIEYYLQELRTLVRPDEAPSTKVLRRQKLLPALRQCVSAGTRRRRILRFWNRVGIGALTFAAAAGLVAMVFRAPPHDQSVATATPATDAEVGVAVTSGTVFVNQPAGRRQLAAGQDIDVGADDSLETTVSEQAQVRLAGIASVLLREETNLVDIGTRAGQVDRIRLTQGSVHLKVTKLAADRRFHVETPDADVQVKGTEFDVNLIAEPTPHTCVRVQEGMVQVTAGAVAKLVGPGDTWGCGESSAKSVTTMPQPPDRPERRPHNTLAASDLSIQNELFQRALSNERAGLYSEAGAAYRVLLRRYPTGPLAAQARANLSVMPREK